MLVRPCATASFKKAVSTSRSFLLGDIRDGLGHLLIDLLQENTSLMNASVSDLFRGVKERMMGINAQDVVRNIKLVFVQTRARV